MDAIFYDPEIGLKSKAQMRKLLKSEGYDDIEIAEFLAKQKVNQLTKPNIIKLYHKIVAPPRSFQCDLMFYKEEKQQNHGYIGILLCIDITSRYLFAYPIKNKNNETMMELMREFISEAKPINITTDMGQEFNSRSIDKLMSDNKVKHWVKDPTDRTSLGKIDRVCRTMRDKIERYRTAYDTKNWYDVIDKLVKNYNNSEHSKLNGNTPAQVWKDKEKQKQIDRQERRQSYPALMNMMNFNIGDKVRVLKRSRAKRGNTFNKGGDKWSKKIYKIEDINKYSYYVKGKKGYKPYRQHELMKVDDVVENPFIKKVQQSETHQKKN